MSDNEQPTPASKPRGSFLGRLLIAAFMAAVVASECLFAYFWLPERRSGRCASAAAG